MLSGADLRRLSLGELLDRIFTLYRGHFWLFVGIMALPQSIAVILSLGFGAFVNPWAPVRAGGGARPGQAEMAQFMGSLLIGSATTLIAYFFVYAVALGATTVAVSEVYLGRHATIRGAYQKIRGRFWRLIDLVVSASLRVFGFYILTTLGFFLFAASVGYFAKTDPILAVVMMSVLFLAFLGSIALTIWMSLRYGVSIPALLLENVNAREAMRRSVLLTKGHRGRVFLVLMLMVVITYALTLLFQGPALVAILIAAGRGHVSVWLQSLSAICGGAGGALSAPLLMIGLSLLYYDLRVRKEAFDLQVMMDALPPAAPPSPGAPASSSNL